MLSPHKKLLMWGLPIVLLLGATWAVGQKQLAASEASTAASKAPATDYVGDETCVGCHEDQQKRFKNTVMGKIFARPRTELEKLGCESCHGPGKAHVEAGGGKDTIPLRFGKDSNNEHQRWIFGGSYRWNKYVQTLLDYERVVVDSGSLRPFERRLMLQNEIRF